MKEFDKSSIRIVVASEPKLFLRSSCIDDIEYLRKWKNNQRQYFFFQEEITSSQQIKWFESYIERPFDFLMMTVFDENVFGCMGIRYLEDHWDVYNVIVGDPFFAKKGLMGLAFKELISYALNIKCSRISLKVLKSNPAVDWYKRHSFIICEEYNGFFSMNYDKSSN